MQEKKDNFPLDGYIKFHCEHTTATWNSEALPLSSTLLQIIEQLDTFRTRVYDQKLIGIYENGIGYGNLSHRIGENFVITASATGGARELGIDGYTLVHSVLIENNTVKSIGPLPASSETMTHAAIYQVAPKIQCILHIHNQIIFDTMIKNNSLSTEKNIPYGTIEMAQALKILAQKYPLEASIVMQGHNEGVIIYGTSIEHVESQLNFLTQEVKKLHCKKCQKGETHG